MKPRDLTRRSSLAALLAALLVLALAPAARAAFDDPLFVFTPSAGVSVIPSPSGYFNGPCGLAVDSAGRFYVADYYHRTIDLYSAGANYAARPTDGSTGYLSQLTGLDSLDGPCALALDSSNRLYVNDYHRGVERFGAYPSFGAGSAIAGTGVDSADPTGVAVDPATDDAYVDDRTSIAVYDSSGTSLGQIGAASLGDGYGIAVSGYPGSGSYSSTAGYLYLPDASTDTVKVYDPATDTANPIAQITGPPGGFADLHDSAVAVDDTSGEIYVIDTLGAQYTEHPQATVDVFYPDGTYEGRLKYNVVNGGPSGLAVDNSANSSQGRVYVTSGISVQASVYAYPPGAATSTALPASFALSTASAGSGAGAISSDLGGIDCASSCSTQIRSGANVTLAATPDAGSTFAGWSGGGCEGTGDCTVAMGEAHSVSATFEAQQSAAGDSGASQSSPPALPPSAQPEGVAATRHVAEHRHRKHRARSRRHHRHRAHHHRRRVHHHGLRHHRKSR